MEKVVSVRIKSLKMKQVKYYVHHDFRSAIPGYVDATRSHLNKIVYSECINADDVIEKIKEEVEFIKNDFHSANKRKLRSDASAVIVGVITFSKTARDFVNDEKNFESLDAAALDFVNKFSNKYNSKVVYVVRHCDETTTHYHFMIYNYNYKNHKTVRHMMKKKDTSQLQDLAAACFEKLGFKRGKHLAKRIKDGDENTRNWGNVSQIHTKMLEELARMKIDIEEKQEKKKKLKETLKKLEEEFEKRKKEYEKLEENLKILDRYRFLFEEENAEEKKKKAREIVKNILEKIDLPSGKKKKIEYDEFVKYMKSFASEVIKYLERVSTVIFESREKLKEAYQILEKRDNIINSAFFDVELSLTSLNEKVELIEELNRLKKENKRLRRMLNIYNETNENENENEYKNKNIRKIK